jgi:hypothetical protein
MRGFEPRPAYFSIISSVRKALKSRQQWDRNSRIATAMDPTLFFPTVCRRKYWQRPKTFVLQRRRGKFVNVVYGFESNPGYFSLQERHLDRDNDGIEAAVGSLVGSVWYRLKCRMLGRMVILLHKNV